MFISMTAGQHFALMFLQAYPLSLVIVGLTVLFLRPDNPNARLLILVFGGFLAGRRVFAEAVAGLKPFEGLIHPGWLRGAFVSFEAVMWMLSSALFNWFFAILSR